MPGRVHDVSPFHHDTLHHGRTCDSTSMPWYSWVTSTEGTPTRPVGRSDLSRSAVFSSVDVPHEYSPDTIRVLLRIQVISSPVSMGVDQSIPASGSNRSTAVGLITPMACIDGSRYTASGCPTRHTICWMVPGGTERHHVLYLA